MGALSAGATYLLTGGNMTYTWAAFIVAAIITALVGPSIVTFLGGDSDWI